jgi:geranylgeranyl diphosphate synthase, type I
VSTSILPTSAAIGEPNVPPPALQRAADLVAPAIEEAVGRLSAELRAPVAHHLAGGGKRVRAALVLLSAAAAGADEEVGVVGAVAIELIHNFSLLHDDIIDEDRERRHRPTAWAEFGVGRAIVAGDALATLALQILLEDPTPERVAATVSLAAATQAMIAGQADDMAFESRATVSVEECIAMEEGKTGALLACAAALGATLAGAPEAAVDALYEFGANLGTAFQAVDDMLGIWGDPATTGKPVGSDLLRGKKTLPVTTALERDDEAAATLRSILGGDMGEEQVRQAAELLVETGVRDEMRSLAEAHLDRAVAALERVDLAPGPVAELLAIADFIASRDR